MGENIIENTIFYKIKCLRHRFNISRYVNYIIEALNQSQHTKGKLLSLAQRIILLSSKAKYTITSQII